MNAGQNVHHRTIADPDGLAPPTISTAPGGSPRHAVPSPRAASPSKSLTDTVLGLAQDAATPSESLSSPRAERVGAPTVVAEHALLGALLLLPNTIPDVERFLGVRDFAGRDTRAVYQALRGLQQAGALFDLGEVAPHLRWDAAHENQHRLHVALIAPGSPHATTDAGDVSTLIAAISDAAPVDGMSLRGVFEPGMPTRLARLVLEDSCRRQLAASGVALRRETPLVPPARSLSTRDQRRTQALLDNLTRVSERLDVLAARLARAVHHEHPPTTNTAGASPAPAGLAAGSRESAATATAGSRSSMAERLSRVLRRRAERHLVHLALHAGNLNGMPAEILGLAPEHFADARHATTWRAIQQLRQSGQPVNYVTVLHHLHTTTTAGPTLSDRALIAMAAAPVVAPHRIARSLSTFATGALRDITAKADVALATAAADRSAPLAEAVSRAAAEVQGLTSAAHDALTHQQTAHTHRLTPHPGGRHRAR